MIESIVPVDEVDIRLRSDYPHEFKEWRTNRHGTEWACLMGMSWEYIDPPQEVIDEYKRLSGIL